MSERLSPGTSTVATGIAAIAVVVLAALELFSFLAVSAARRQWFSYDRLQSARVAIAESAAAPAATPPGQQMPWFVAQEVVHPYLGFVLDRSFERCQPELAGYTDVLDFGFSCSDVPLIQHRSADKVILGIFGGSVAHAFPAPGMGPLREELARSPRFAGKQIVVVPLALPGYKQPQQLMTLTYFLMLGGEFDLVINLDGFNEVALPAVENVPKGVFPLFPRSWFFRAGALDPATRTRMGEVAWLRDRRAVHAKFFSHAPLRYSTTAALLWTLLDRIDVIRASTAQAKLLKERTHTTSFVQQGPARTYPDKSAMFADLVAAWHRSSLQMHLLSQANGATYYHFLQPNQYLPGSKPIADGERRLALRDSDGFRHSVEVGYPLARAAGRQLVSSGVRFHDMTQVFASERRPVYVDDCCHFDVTGYEILARAMGRAIVADGASAAAPGGR